ncbi:MAG TPA: PBP1A family penicillin-binding protein [Methylomirabilota bacterium]|nr:PBP1A family penicillin-binding protein [Methylomirabilota bacterium]
MAGDRRSKRAALQRRRWLRWALMALLVVVLVGALGIAASAFWVLTILPGSLPSVTQLENFDASEGTKVYDDNDELITEFHVERRIFVPLAQIPKTLRDAVIATEDARFYSHHGVDPTGIARAIYQNFRRGRIVEGGSTITQQLAKVLFLTPDKSLERKLKEAVLALELERRYSKDRILEMYLNQIYFGHGAFGVEAAARTFFGKGVSELSLAECTLLAGLPKAPSTYSPFEHPEAAKRRRATVLARMVDVGSITQPVARKTAESALGLIPPERRRTTGQYYLEYVQQQLEAQYGADLVFKGGLQVYTTLSPVMQVKAERALREGLKALESRRVAATKDSGTPAPERPEGALLAIDPQTGYIKAMVGGYDFFKSEFNRAVQARRQPGSAFKPFVYLAALESGQTPASVVDDSPIEFPAGRNGKAWKPDNYDRKFRGPITYQQALEESVNVAAVKVLEKNGIRHTLDLARRLGVESPLGENLSIALGTSDLTLLEITSAYGALANQGAWVRPSAIRYVLDSQRKLLEENTPQARQVVSPELAYVMTSMLRGTIERGTGVAARALGRPAAAKTGTTNDYSNAWFIGYTPQLVTGVWVGYDRPRSLGKDETGSRVAVPIWTSFMQEALAGTPPEDFPIPERVVLVPVDLNPSGGCVRPVTMAFVAGTEPKEVCGPARYAPGVSPPRVEPPLLPAPPNPATPGPAPSLPPPAAPAPTAAPPAPSAAAPAPAPARAAAMTPAPTTSPARVSSP